MFPECVLAELIIMPRLQFPPRRLATLLIDPRIVPLLKGPWAPINIVAVGPTAAAALAGPVARLCALNASLGVES